MQPPVQGCLPTLEELGCGNATGLRPQAITRAQLNIARPLQQVKARLSWRADRSWVHIRILAPHTFCAIIL